MKLTTKNHTEMKNIKFRRSHFKDEGLTVFSHFTYWGVEIDWSSFVSPSTNNFALYHIDEQFTGFIDKNGTEIYEGDVIKIDDINYGYGGDYDKKHDGYLYQEISFEDGCFCLRNGIELYNHTNCEVIGNIHENPELL